MSEPREDFEIIHEALIEKYQSDHPEANWQEACAATADAAYTAYVQSIGEKIDAAYDFHSED